MKKIILSTIILCGSLLSFGQNNKVSFVDYCKKNNIFNHLEAGLTLGTTGIGIDLGAPITDWVKMRMGISYFPQATFPFDFNLTQYSDGVVTEDNFDHVSEMMEKITGYEIDKMVRIDGKPNLFNFKMLFDVYPFKNNRHWHFTAGFFLGPKRIAKGINTMNEMTSLMSLNLYNRMYDYFTTTDFFDTPIYGDIYLDPEVADMLKQTFEEYGRLGIHVGDFRDGQPYIMQPDKHGMVTVNAYVNVLRPYLGFGYGGAISKDKRWNVSVDAGVMFWGGSPNLVTHDGVSLTHDVVDIKGKVGDKVDLITSIKVYPVLDFRISYTIF